MKTMYTNRGFTLIEVLIALIIIAVGLLGLAALQSQAQQAEIESYQRSQALIILNDIVNRLNTNREAINCYDISNEATGSPFLGTNNATTYACAGAGSTATRALADADLAALDALLKGSGEVLSGTNAGAMIGGRACISNDGSGIYKVEVVWQGLMETVANADDLCGTGLYGSEAKRRVVTSIVRLADLT